MNWELSPLPADSEYVLLRSLAFSESVQLPSICGFLSDLIAPPRATHDSGIRVIPLEKLATKLDAKKEVLETLLAFLEDTDPEEALSCSTKTPTARKRSAPPMLDTRAARPHKRPDGSAVEEDATGTQSSARATGDLAGAGPPTEARAGALRVLPGATERIDVMFHELPREVAQKHAVAAAVVAAARSSRNGRFSCRLGDLCEETGMTPEGVLSELAALAGVREGREEGGLRVEMVGGEAAACELGIAMREMGRREVAELARTLERRMRAVEDGKVRRLDALYKVRELRGGVVVLGDIGIYTVRFEGRRGSAGLCVPLTS